MTSNTTSTELKVAIIGSGFAGICMAIKLREAGIEDFEIFEKSDSLGGTWRDNTYPGSGCDVPSFLYQFSFEVKTDWSRKFAEHHEILDYMRHCARKYGLEPHIRYNTEIAEANWDETAARWRLRTRDGREITTRVLVSGTGQLNRPFTPEIPGLNDFRGTMFHSARWNHEYDLTGKRIVVIGNGASALQFVPPIAQKVARLSLIARTPNWVVEKPDYEYSRGQKEFFARHPILTRLYRWKIYWQHELRWPVFSRDSFLGRLTAKQGARDIARLVHDPRLREILTPKYAVGCKRILQSTDYFQALTRDNVEVIPTGIEKITANGVVLKDGRTIEADAIIFGTGFDSTGFLAPMKVTGRNGLDLNEAWKDGAEAYLGVAVSGFPNFYILYGPNTNLGHNSIIFMIECQVGYIMQCLGRMREQKLRALDVRRDTMDSYNREVQAALGRTVWATGCSSWYKNESGRITNNWGYGTVWYWWKTRRPDWSAFQPEP